MRRLAQLCVFAFKATLLLSNLKLRACDLLVQSRSGKYLGTPGVSRDGGRFHQWLGIRYAQPPIGDLRFEPPVIVEPHEGIHNSVEYPVKCSQIDVLKTFTGKEDCLFLNIYSPYRRYENGTKKPLFPVMMFVHGGYFRSNTGNDFHANYFMDEDVILVTFNYRLGVLGFLNTGDEAIRGNMGLKDQAMALRWVSENIEAFGGDPKRITLFGQSAGAVAVHMHLLSPLSKPYLNRAISQSGTALVPWGIYKDPVGQAKWFGNVTGCGSPGQKGSSKKMVQCLKKMSVEKLYEFWMSKSIFEPGSTWTRTNIFVPTIEAVKDSQAFLTDDPEVLMKSGNFNRIPFMSGVTSGEGLVLTGRYIYDMTERKDLFNNWKRTSEILLNFDHKEQRIAKIVRDYYFPPNITLQSDTMFKLIRDLVSDRNFFVAHQDALKWHSNFAPAYAYFYDHPSEFSIFNVLSSIKGNKRPLFEVTEGLFEKWWDRIRNKTSGRVFYGSCHGDELFVQAPMKFHVVTRQHPDYMFSKDVVSLWVQFASAELGDLRFRDQSFQPFQRSDEFRQFALRDRNPGVQMIPYMESYKFWKIFENVASLTRISTKLLTNYLLRTGVADDFDEFLNSTDTEYNNEYNVIS